MKLTELKGVGPKTEFLLEKTGVGSVEELLEDYPLHYEQYDAPTSISALVPDKKQAVRAMVAGRVSVRNAGGRAVVTTEVTDSSGRLRVTWFNAAYLRNILRPGGVYVFRGKVIRRGKQLVMEHPEILSTADYEEKMKTLVPVYGLTKGLSGKAVIRAVREALKHTELLEEYLPESALRLMGLPDESAAIRGIHFPKDQKEMETSRNRLVFDEFFLFILLMRLLKLDGEEAKNAFPMKKTWAVEDMISKLPYRLTHAQMRVFREIENDLAGKRLMSRLVQGDVGSGKTIIAFLAMLMTAENGYQSALMAPTEVLARQHYEKLCALKESMKLDVIKPALLVGTLTEKQKRSVRERIAGGDVNAIIGTQALIQDQVAYKDLALVITDEQHRFGVAQRRKLSEKGDPPNVLVMSATPIPRTLAVVYYSDLDLSVIDELPARRKPIKNAVVDESYRGTAMNFIKKETEAGHQVYVICPMIEASEGLDVRNVIDEEREIRRTFPDVPVGLLHGRLRPEEKDEVMDDFKSGKIRILVSTTVVEVGVDVPNATVMLIENAERFGLSTLHQLRGRVGRGEAQSYCIFMAGDKSELTKKRLSVLQKTNDGFRIAEEDLKLRGPGDLLGIRQSGEAAFHLADPSRDREMMKLAGSAASSILSDDPDLLHEEHQLLKKRLHRYRLENEKNLTL